MANMTAQLALEECLKYVHQRVALVKPFGPKCKSFVIISGYGNRFRETSKEFTYRVAAQNYLRYSLRLKVSMAKILLHESSDSVTHEAVQIFGGMGFMRKSG